MSIIDWTNINSLDLVNLHVIIVL